LSLNFVRLEPNWKLLDNLWYSCPVRKSSQRFSDCEVRGSPSGVDEIKVFWDVPPCRQ